MTPAEYAAEINKVMNTGQTKQMRTPPGRRIYVLGNMLVIHHPGGPDNGTAYRTPNAIKEYNDS
jgi:hypothetical protein